MQQRKVFPSCLAIVFFLLGIAATAQQKDTVRFDVLLNNPVSHSIHITMMAKLNSNNTVYLKMPQWTPGYYQVMNYANRLSHFEVKDGNHQILEWKKTDINTWQIKTARNGHVVIDYDVRADSAFVATSFVDTTHAYVTPAATFLYIDKQIQTPVSLTVQLYRGWNSIATGLDTTAGCTYTYTAPDFDVLYDCPILAGNLEELPSFTVGGVTHRFIGYQLGDFNKTRFMDDLKRIVITAVNIIQDIPYKHYTFLAIGNGNGGIEHLTSSANSFDGNSLNTEEGRKRILSFLAHEYFHNYNVKRIRPVELGPFDYDNGSKTRQLWVSEGWTVYYEYLLLKRAGIITDADLYKNFQTNILAYERHTGKLHQSLAQASAATWNDGPFGNDPDKTISYYDKGPVVALLLDFAIRHFTHNKKSLDDVMRTLYKTYYQQKQRGFTEDELQGVCEQTAGRLLPEIFRYVYTTNPLNYSTYLTYGGLSIDLANQSFAIQPLPNPDPLQQIILKSWLKN